MSKENIRRREIGQERRERTRQKLLEAAARVVAERGEAKATIDDFIQAADVARGTFYNYYSTRKDLLDDLWKSIGRNPYLEILRACEGLVDPAEYLMAITRLVFLCTSTQRTWGWLIYAMSADAESVNEDLQIFPRPILQEGRRQGRFVFNNLDSASDMVVGSIRSALRATLDGARSQESVQEICVLLLKALGIADKEARDIAERPLPDISLHNLPKNVVPLVEARQK